MLPRFARGKFYPKNTEKYVGLKTPTYRSSWEHAFMRLCDEHPNVYKWASESMKEAKRNRHSFKRKWEQQSKLDEEAKRKKQLEVRSILGVEKGGAGGIVRLA